MKSRRWLLAFGAALFSPVRQLFSKPAPDLREAIACIAATLPRDGNYRYDFWTYFKAMEAQCAAEGHDWRQIGSGKIVQNCRRCCRVGKVIA